MLEALIAMAALAGNTVVAAATTDAWEAARRGFARLLGRGDPDRTKMAEQRLDQTRQQLEGADGEELEKAQADLAKAWQVRLADLRALVQEIQAALPAGVVSAADHSAAAGRDMNIDASGGGFAAAVFHGNVALPGPTDPGLAGG